MGPLTPYEDPSTEMHLKWSEDRTEVLEWEITRNSLKVPKRSEKNKVLVCSLITGNTRGDRIERNHKRVSFLDSHFIKQQHQEFLSIYGSIIPSFRPSETSRVCRVEIYSCKEN